MRSRRPACASAPRVPLYLVGTDITITLSTAAVASGLRVGPEVTGVPPRRVDPMALPATLTAAELKRQRKMAKRARELR